MCDCFHLAFPNWHAASSEPGGGRRLRGAEPVPEDNSICDEPSQFTEGERPRPQGSSPVEEYPEMEKYTDSDKECEAEHDPHRKSGGGKKSKKSGLGSMFEKRTTLKASKLKEAHSPESEVIVKTAQDGCAEGLIYGGGGRDGIFIKEVVPESPASKSLKLKEGDQLLSATVYFDNVPYEDAIQILGCAQAYKVKLCLKRKPDIIETEPMIDSDVIPEDETFTPEMRERGKTKRRTDARISWPKFHTLGKKSTFTRSHSSSEADEQRKLELSPTTSDTESPIKSQDALKGKKKNKLRLSFLKKRGRVSSSEDLCSDTPTHKQISGKSPQTSDVLSPDGPESPPGETPEVYVTEDRKEVGDFRPEQTEQTQTHKMELISIDSTLKTEDLTVALADQGTPTGTKSPDGKKKKKERSEIKIKILGKDKSHKKDAKSKASPKRLKTLGASIEIADQPENEKSSTETHKEQQGDEQALDAKTQPISSESLKVTSELAVPDAKIHKKSPKKGEEKTKKGKDKQKQDTKTFKLPKLGFCDITIEEEVQNKSVNVEERTIKTEQLTSDGTDVKEDPYDRLSKGSLSKTQLPKREDIEIPGMEDVSKKTTVKGMKESKVVYAGRDEVPSETIPISIDVDSVKEAVSKLPGYKLPKVDTSGVPIPEEITVIDANAQRISVKTPTKVLDAKTKHETHFTKFDISASPSISKTTDKIPKITPADLTSEVLIIETKTQKTDKSEDKQSSKEIRTEVYNREDIIIPGKETVADMAGLQAQDDDKSKKTKKSTHGFGIAMPDFNIPNIGFDLSKQNVSLKKDDNLQGERTIFLQDVQTTITESKTAKGHIGGVESGVKVSEIEGIEYIDSVAGLSAEKDESIKGFGFNLDAAKPNVDISLSEIKSGANEQRCEQLKLVSDTSDININLPRTDKVIIFDGAEIRTVERERRDDKFKTPNLGISVPKVEGPKIDLGLSKKDVDVKLPGAKVEAELKETPKFEATLGHSNVSIHSQNIKVEKPELEIKPQQTEHKLDGQGSKIKIPELGIKIPKIKAPQLDLSLSKKDVDVKLSEANTEIKLPEAGKTELSVTEQKMEIRKPDLEIKSMQTEDELDRHGSKMKMPTIGITIPKLEGPEFNISLSKKDVDVTLPEAKAEVDVHKISVDMKSPKIEPEVDVKGSKFKKLEMAMPKVKMPEIDFSLSKKETDVKPPEVKAEVSLLDAELKEPSVDINVSKSKTEKNVEGSSKFKMPSLKFGGATQNVGVEISKKSKVVPIPETQLKPLEEGLTVDITAPSIDTEGPSLEVKKTQADVDGKGHKFKMPKLGISVPKVKGPEIDLSLSQKEVDQPKAKAEISLPDVEHTESGFSAEIKAPEVALPQADVKGSALKFKMPKFKLPNFGSDMPNVSAEVSGLDKDAKIERPDMSITVEELAVNRAAPSIDLVGPSVEMQTAEAKMDEKGIKFKMPHLGLSMPKAKGPTLDFSLSKKEADVTLPVVQTDVKLPKADLGIVDVSIPENKILVQDFKAEVKLPETSTFNVEMKPPEFDTDGTSGTFKVPSSGISLPGVKGPEIDMSLSKKDVDMSLPQTKVEVKLPDTRKIDVSLGKAEVKIPEATVEVKQPEVEIKPLQTDADFEKHGGKFKMPKFGIKMPKLKGPDIDLNFSRKDADITLPEVSAAVKVPGVGLTIPSATVETKAPKIEAQLDLVKESPSRLILPTLDQPTPIISADIPNKDILIEGAELKVPKDGITLDIAAQNADIVGPSLDLKMEESEGGVKEGKFKLPKFGISLPKVQGTKIDMSSSKKSVDVKLPDAKTNFPEAPAVDVSLGKVDVSISDATIEVEKPHLGVKSFQSEGELAGSGGSPTKYKLPTIKLPGFGVTMPSAAVEVPEIKTGPKKGEAIMNIPEETLTVDVKGPSIDSKRTETEMTLKGGKFKMPKLGVTMPAVSGPEFDLSLSKKESDVTPPGADIKLKTERKDTKGSPSKYKLPTIKMPKFGASLPSATVEVPESDKDLKIDGVDIKIPEKELKVDVEAPSIDIEGPSVDIKTKETEHGVKGGRFKLPKLGVTMPKVSGPEFDLSLSKKDVDVTLPEAKAEVTLPGVEMKAPSADVDIKAPEIKVQTKDKEGSPSKFKMPAFKLPKFGVTMPSATVELPESDKDLKIDGVDIKIPEEELKVDVEAPSIDIEGPSVDIKTKETEHGVKGGRLKMPKLGMTMPKVSGPEFDLSLSKKDVDVTLPEAKAEVTLPGVEMKAPSAEVDIKAPEIKVQTKDKEGSPSKFKLPAFKLPKFGASLPSTTVELPESDKNLKIDGVDIKIPEKELKVDVEAPSIDIEGPSVDIKTKETEHGVKGGRFKMPKLGMTMPKVSGPEFDLSLSKKDVDVTLPEAKAEVTLPGVEMKSPSAEVDIKAPEIKVQTKDKEGSPSKFKMPGFKLPKFGVTMPSATVELPESDKDLKIDGVDIKIPEKELKVDVETPSIDIEGPSVDIKTKETEHGVKGGRFKMPKLGMTMPKVSGPEFDLSLSKKDVDVTLPEAKAEVTLPGVEIKAPSAEVDIKAPEIKVQTKDKEGSPSKFKMPAFKLPKFGASLPSTTVELPESDKDLKIDGVDIKIPEKELKVDVEAPSIDIEGPSVDIKTKETEHGVKGGRFKMPKLGMTMPKVSGPEFDLSLSKKDVDVTLPEAKAEVTLPGVEMKAPSADVDIKAPEIKVQTKDKEGSPSKFKMPAFKLPKFGASLPSTTVELPESDKDLKIDGVDIKIPEKELKVDVETPSIDIEGPSVDIKTKETEHGVKGGRFKMPKLGMTMPKVSGPEFDLSLSKKDVDVTLPEAKAEVKLPGVEMKAPSADVDFKVQTKDKEGSPSKFKMPGFKLPKFGVTMPSATVELPESDKDLKIDGVDIKIPEKELKVDVETPSIDIEGPSVDIKTKETEHGVKGGRFKMPKLGMTMPKVSGPEFDLSLSKKDVDVTLSEARGEVTLPGVEMKAPSAEVDIKAPEIKVQTKDKEGSPSKFKMPAFKLPKFGVTMPSATVELPESDKELKIDGVDIKIPEKELKVDVEAPSIDIEGPSVDIKTKETEHGVKGGRFKMPKLGMTMPKVSGPEFDLSLSKKDVDVTLPEAKAEVTLPGVEMKAPSAEVDIKAPEIKVQTKDKEGSPSKFKMPGFKLPKFGASLPSPTVELPESDKELKIDGVDIKIPEKELKVDVEAPSIDIEGPSVDIKTKETEHGVKGGRFKMPKLGVTMPKVSGPEFDLSLSKKDVDVTLPEAKAEVKLPGVEMKAPSAEVDIKAPEIKVQTKDKEGSPSKFKMPAFRLPKFGVTMPSATAEVPDSSKALNVDGSDINIPEEVLTVDITAPSGDERISFDIKSTESVKEGKGGKFKMPSLGFSAPHVKGPNIDLSLSKKEMDMTLPEAKAEVNLAEFELKDTDVKASNVEGSPSKFKMPIFRLPKFGAATAQISAEVPDIDKNIKIEKEKLEVDKEGAAVGVSGPSVDFEGRSVDVKGKGSGHEGSGSVFKLPSLGISMSKVKGPEIDVSLPKKDVDATLPEVSTEVKLPNVEVKDLKDTSKIPDAASVEVDAKLRQSSWTFPKFSFSSKGAKASDVDVNLETPEVDVSSKDAKADPCPPGVDVQGPSGTTLSEEPPAIETDAHMKKSKFSLPRLSFSKSSVKEPEVSAGHPHVDVSLPEGKVIVTQPSTENKVALESENDGQGSKFKLPKFGIALPKAKGPQEESDASQKDVDIKLPDVKVQVKLPEIEVKSSSSVGAKTSETEAKAKDAGGSPLKLKADGAQIKIDGSKESTKDMETPTETEGIGPGSPSKFRLPSLKMPKLSFTRPKTEDQNVSVETECQENQQETDVKEESKSPKLSLTSFGEIFKTIDVEFDVSKTDKAGANLETSKEVHKTVEHSGKQTEAKEKETQSKQDSTKSPERTGWFKFPKFGLSSPSEPAKIPEKDKEGKSPETMDDTVSPTCSVQSSDAFADISSAVTSEHVGLSLSSPTKVTVKYSDPNAATGLEEVHSNIITSTTRTELISVEPNLPEKITILSSGVSSSSEDTLRLESGKIHVITSNIEATPEAQHAKLLTTVKVQSAAGSPLQSESSKAASWTVEESQSSRKTVYERRLVTQTSGDGGEHKETVVITKQITRMLDPSEHLSGETASSIQRLRETVHTEKMKFFDEAEK
ncbi:uncharacterized protein LOC141806708 [Halichoeres trimaculatus]|uniref:uncharacterized protein LOC141806708 n=1 Tax=Halichoeres trimaculatus TaxID=147232 RepID=UPI003D9DD3E9